MTMAFGIAESSSTKMENVLTIVSPNDIAQAEVDAFAEKAGATQIDRLSRVAVDLYSDEGEETLRALVPIAQGKGFDAAVNPAEGRRKAVLISDMDSTIIAQECLDELAELAGCGGEIKEITERAMRGELDFDDALIHRVAKLRGLPVSTVDQVLSQRISLSPGARTLVSTMAANGAVTALVSGGFTLFTGPVAEQAGFANHYGNTLEVSDDETFTGKVVFPILGQDAKRERLLELCTLKQVDLGAALAIGDGANDLAMIEKAGLGIAYRAKPVVAAAADAAIQHTNLKSALYFQGYREDEFRG
ncbi:MAG: phosphoserine phosphatase SerB [Pseudomonadota bacterium]